MCALQRFDSNPPCLLFGALNIRIKELTVSEQQAKTQDQGFTRTYMNCGISVIQVILYIV